jgi:fumarate reductase flavoprotein subunit
MMGGIDTNIDTATIVPGLYAAGECAAVTINGANRLGSNSLTELLVFGARAGKNAAEWARAHRDFDVPALERQAQAEQERISMRYIRNTSGKERIATLRTEMQHAMETGCGVYREDASIRATTEKLAELKERFRSGVHLDDQSLSFNTELTAALELEFMIEIAEAVAHSALNRTESRGSHQRTDFIARDDTNYLKHSMAFRTEGTPRVDYKDVVITKWPPAERVYGRAEH